MERLATLRTNFDAAYTRHSELARQIHTLLMAAPDHYYHEAIAAVQELIEQARHDYEEAERAYVREVLRVIDESKILFN